MDIVYLTTNKVNGKQYVGSHTTENLDDNYLGSGIIIKKAVKKYGKVNFKKEILKICESREEAILLEEYFINENNSLIPTGYNISPYGNAAFSGEKNPMYGKDPWNKGKKGIYSKETIEKIRNSLKGNTRRLGKKHSKETRQKISDASKGRVPWIKGKKHSKETIQKLSISHKGQIPWNKDKKTSEETKKKLSEAHKGKKLNVPYGICKYCGVKMKMGHLNRYHNDNCKKGFKSYEGIKHSEETKKKIGEKNKGKKRTLEMIEKNRKSHIGITHTDESKKKMSEIAKKRKATEKTKKILSESHKGQIPWNKGLKIGKRSEETKKKISETLKRSKIYKNIEC